MNQKEITRLRRGYALSICLAFVAGISTCVAAIQVSELRDDLDQCAGVVSSANEAMALYAETLKGTQDGLLAAKNYSASELEGVQKAMEGVQERVQPVMGEYLTYAAQCGR